jgi:serine protease inhibitor
MKPEKIIYSDDNEEKLEWAKSLWIQTFVFHNFEEFVQDLQKYWIEI